jgi:transcriptional antiterminator NusG
MPRQRWLVLCLEGKVGPRGVSYPDNRVRKEIKRRSKIEGLEKSIGRILIVKHTVVEVRKGVRKEITKRSYPGYLLAKLKWSDEVHHLLQSVRGVAGILPTLPPLSGWSYPGKGRGKTYRKPTKTQVEQAIGWKPVPVDDDDVRWIILRMQTMKDRKGQPVKLDLTIGDRVMIKSGSFVGVEGVIKEVNGSLASPKVTVEAEVMKQPVPVVLDWYSVEKR